MINIRTITILTAIFAILKLTGQISWSWWWVLAPAWIPASIFLVLLLVVVVACDKKDVDRAMEKIRELRKGKK
mgnify:CR=1 FL=1